MSARHATPFAVVVYEVEEPRAIVEVTGELDLGTAPVMKRYVEDAVGAGRTELVVDLSGVTFIDSTSLAVLVGARERLPGGRLAVVTTDRRVLAIFEVAGLEDALEVFSTRDEAEAWLTDVREG
jgi:anti-sigma B factor antagonist